jgi:hypothetical protein
MQREELTVEKELKPNIEVPGVTTTATGSELVGVSSLASSFNGPWVSAAVLGAGARAAVGEGVGAATGGLTCIAGFGIDPSAPSG